MLIDNLSQAIKQMKLKKTSDYFSAKSKLHWEHLQVYENMCKQNCNTVKLFKQNNLPTMEYGNLLLRLTLTAQCKIFL